MGIRHRCQKCNGICERVRVTTVVATTPPTRSKVSFMWECKKCGACEKVAPRIRKPKKMQCNNCGGQMMRSQTRYYITVCNAGCGMVHDWSNVKGVKDV